jgi:alginate O-acetyltransferase complex protein AlgI
MLFDSIDFALFLPIVFILYWFVANKNLKLQNFLLIIVSYIFYGWWDWRFLSLIIFSTIVDYIVGHLLFDENNNSKRKILLWTSIMTNIGLLGFFKYCNFFIDNFTSAFSFFGMDISGSSLHIILPVGISFYTFQTLSYTIDVYRKNIKPKKDFIAFSAYVSFFPQLVAGPIERATNLLPQFHKNRNFEYSKAVDGTKQILWGFFKKIVIANNCALLANELFNHTSEYQGISLILGALFFTFQIYSDFSGYSDIAIGTSRLFGFNLMQNFAFPYFSRDIAEFWRRWHISLSTWFRDYLYIPLGGSRGGILSKIRNTFIIFIVSGFWHGANWTFIIWGALNAFYFLPLLLTNKNRNHIDTVAKGKLIPSFREFRLMLFTFSLTVFAWIFFRAENLDHAFQYIFNILKDPGSIFTFSIYWNYKKCILLIGAFIIVEWLGRQNKYAIEYIPISRFYKWFIYMVIIFSILLLGEFDKNQFIYFQF